MGRWKPATGVLDGEEKELTSRYFKENTYVHRDNLGRILLIFEWDEEGSKLCEQITERLIGHRLAIFEGDKAVCSEDGTPLAPIIRGVITDRGQRLRD